MRDDVSSDRHSIIRQFPALRLLEAARVAVAPVSLMIGSLAAIILRLLIWIVDRAIPIEIPAGAGSLFTDTGPIAFGTGENNPWRLFDVVVRPWSSAVRPVVAVLVTSPSWNGWGLGLAQLLVAIGLWSIVGTTLCRRSALLMTKGDESSVQRAGRYSLRRWTASAMGPLTPLFSAGLLAVIVAGFGLIGRLPFVGWLWLVLMSPVILMLSFGAAFLLITTAFAWPLMVASVATDDCDSFGGLSRAYSGLTGRPWQAFGFICAGLIAGFLLMSFVGLFGVVTYWCATSSAAIGAGTEQIQGSLAMPVAFLTQLIAEGVGISYFWSAATMISLLLREEIDGVPLHRLALDDEQRPVREDLPVVGIPATDLPVESTAAS